MKGVIVMGHLLLRRWYELIYFCPLSCHIQCSDRQSDWISGILTVQRELTGLRFFHPALPPNGYFLAGMDGRRFTLHDGIYIMMDDEGRELE